LKLTADALSAHLEQQLLHVYLISGDEPLLTGEAADAIRAAARAKGFTERDVHFLERGSDWDDVRASAGNMSLFGSRRVVEIRMPTGKPGVAGGAALVSMLGIDDRDTIFLILTPRLDRDARQAAVDYGRDRQAVRRRGRRYRLCAAEYIPSSGILR